MGIPISVPQTMMMDPDTLLAMRFDNITTAHFLGGIGRVRGKGNRKRLAKFLRKKIRNISKINTKKLKKLQKLARETEKEGPDVRRKIGRELRRRAAKPGVVTIVEQLEEGKVTPESLDVFIDMRLDPPPTPIAPTPPAASRPSPPPIISTNTGIPGVKRITVFTDVQSARDAGFTVKIRRGKTGRFTQAFVTRTSILFNRSTGEAIVLRIRLSSGGGPIPFLPEQKGFERLLMRKSVPNDNGLIRKINDLADGVTKRTNPKRRPSEKTFEPSPTTSRAPILRQRKSIVEDVDVIDADVIDVDVSDEPGFFTTPMIIGIAAAGLVGTFLLFGGE